MPIKARSFIRKMRGGAQAHLLQAEDGNCYVTKFRNNPQHRRILVNEWIASVFLKYLQIAAAPAAILELTPEFLAANEDIYLQLGSRREAVEPGWHYGSQYPGDPNRVPVYDFLPDALIEKVANIGDFLGVYVADKWMANADARQSIFFRMLLGERRPSASARAGFFAQMIDHGYMFDGPHWNFADSPLQGLYFQPLVYSSVRSLNDFEPWLDRVLHFPDEVIDDAYKQIPLEWIDQDRDAIEELLGKLMTRRRRLPDLIEASRHARTNPFPHWR